jgi:carbonic anhydrase
MPEFTQLLDGYKRFRDGEYHTHRKRWEQLANGQEPPVMLIGCCDSRVEPTRIFDTPPGQMFVVRNVANIVPPYEETEGLHGVSAAIEFAVLSLKVKHVVVMGHGACGGIKAALEGRDHGAQGASFIDHWISVLDEARERVLASGAKDLQLALEFEGIKTGLTNLRTFPYVRSREQDGSLKLHGAHFSIAKGRLCVLDGAEESFRPV